MDEGDADPAPGHVNPVEALVARIPVTNWRVAAGVCFLTLAGLLVLRELGLWWSDAFVWPLILAAGGAAVIWRQSRMLESPAERAESPAGDDRAPGADRREPTTEPRGRGLADIYRGGFGVALVLGAALLFLYANGVLGQARDVVLAIVVAAVALSLILAPFLWRLGRNLAVERAERIRSQERAELAAHLHDSVLQTLTLMQKRADDPREVAALARRQERELRAWLFDGSAPGPTDSLAAAIEAAAAEVEDAHAVAIDVVAVGDRALDDPGSALVAATREALTNAAKFAAGAGADRRLRRDEPGPGAGVRPRPRRRLRPGHRARGPSRAAGVDHRQDGTHTAARPTINSRPGAGTEVELTMEMRPQ